MKLLTCFVYATVAFLKSSHGCFLIPPHSLRFVAADSRLNTSPLCSFSLLFFLFPPPSPSHHLLHVVPYHAPIAAPLSSCGHHVSSPIIHPPYFFQVLARLAQRAPTMPPRSPSHRINAVPTPLRHCRWLRGCSIMYNHQHCRRCRCVHCVLKVVCADAFKGCLFVLASVCLPPTPTPLCPHHRLSG